MHPMLTAGRQKIQYARGRSNVFARLEGVYKAPKAAATTETQPSLFVAPLPSAAAAPVGAAAAADAAKAPDAATNGPSGAEDGAQGVKRRREDESDEEEAPMEEDDDDDVSMEASSEEE